MNTSQMYFNKFSSGTILALLALSGMLVLVPLAAPVHATNANPLVVSVQGYNPVLAEVDTQIYLTVTNPASNQYAVTAITISVPNANWYVFDCEATGTHFNSCTDSVSENSVEFTVTSSGIALPPGGSDTVFFEVYAPYGSSAQPYPFSASFTTTVQDQSNAAFYAGPKFSIQVIAQSSVLTDTLTPGGSNTPTTYVAGTQPYSYSAQLTCTTSEPGCTTGYENGVTVQFKDHNYGSAAVYSYTPSVTTTSGGGSTAGTATTTFQPSNIVSSAENVGAGQPWAGIVAPGCSTSCTFFSVQALYDDEAANDVGGGYTSNVQVTTVAGAPSSVGFTSGESAFNTGSTIYLNNEGSTTNTPTFTGAQLCNTVTDGCTADAAQIAVSVTDKFGNSIAFTSFTSPKITFQTASGGLFDATGLPSIISNYTPTATPQPVPDNYYQSGTYGSAGVITATITGTYNSNAFSVSGSTGSILTSTFATSGSFETTHHTALLSNNVQAGKSLTFEVVLGVAQKNVPVTAAICDHGTCSLTSKGYSGSISTVSGVTNSSGIFSSSLVVDTVAGSTAELNATVSAPTTSTPKATFTIVQNNITTTVSGPAAKFTVVVGVGSSLDPSPIIYSIPGATDYVNVVTSDAYGNSVDTVGTEEVGISLTANPASLSDASPAIPTGCASTNATAFGSGGKYNCLNGDGSSFGPISWTLPSTVGSTGTISATGVINGVVVTSATVTITIVSKLPSLSVTSPVPLKGVIYSDSENAQFRGWANVSSGYNGAAIMSSLGWKIGTASWQTTSLSSVQDATWSVVATLPTGLSSIEFNATDSKGNVVVSSPYQVLVDTQAPVVTNTTPNNATLNPGQFFQAQIVVDQGDLNATSVTVTVNGTAISSTDVQVSGTNDLGTSTTYTVTALLPTGDNTVLVSASSLAGLTGSSTSEIVHVTVSLAESITFTQSEAVYGQVGAYTGVTVPVTNLYSTAQTVVVFATLKSGTSTYVAQGTATINPGQTVNVFTIDLQVVPPGTYSVTFSAVTTSNIPVSAPTTPITVVVA